MGWLKLLKNGVLFVGLRNTKVGPLNQIGFVGHTCVSLPRLIKTCPQVHLVFLILIVRRKIWNIKGCWNSIITRQLNLVSILPNALKHPKWTISSRHQLRRSLRGKLHFPKMNPNQIILLESCWFPMLISLLAILLVFLQNSSSDLLM